MMQTFNIVAASIRATKLYISILKTIKNFTKILKFS